METALIALMFTLVVVATFTSLFRTNRVESDPRTFNSNSDWDERGYSDMSGWRPQHSHGPPPGIAFMGSIGIVVLGAFLLVAFLGVIAK